MNIDKFLNTVNYLNSLIESVTSRDIEDIQKSINLTKLRMDSINAKIQNQLDLQNDSLPFNDVRIEFLSELKLSVRTAIEKAEEEFIGRENFKVLGYSENEYIILQRDDFPLDTGLILYNPNFTARVEQQREVQLFYNENSNVGSGIMTRSSIKKEVKFRFISFN